LRTKNKRSKEVVSLHSRLSVVGGAGLIPLT